MFITPLVVTLGVMPPEANIFVDMSKGVFVWKLRRAKKVRSELIGLVQLVDVANEKKLFPQHLLSQGCLASLAHLLLLLFGVRFERPGVILKL